MGHAAGGTVEECRKTALRCRKNTLIKRAGRTQLGTSSVVPIPTRFSEVLMSRRIRALVALFAVSFVLAATACADTTAPRPGSTPCDTQNSNTCH